MSVQLVPHRGFGEVATVPTSTPGFDLLGVFVTASFVAVVGGSVVRVSTKNPRTRERATDIATYGGLGLGGAFAIALAAAAINGRNGA